MIGLSLLSSVSKHNMWSRQPNHNTTTYCVYWRRQQRQPNHNTTTYCVYWWTTMTTQSYYDHILCLLTDDNNDPIIIRPHIVFTDGPSVITICGRVMIGLSLLSSSVNTICGRIMIGLSFLSFVSKHYVVVLWLGCRWCRPSVNTICGRIMIGLSLSSVSKHNMWS
jgi:hypothetical protein